jgi:outer membrane protein assembly factor BamE
MTPQSARPLLVALALLAAAGCAVYRPDIRQGNFLTDATLAQVQPGMTRAQVEFLLGKPMVADPFHPERWDYFYSFDSKTQPDERRHVKVLFDGDVVREIVR